jgi:hypothetical protein
LVLYAIRKIGARRRPAELGPERGRIAPGKISAVLVVAVALLLTAGGVGALVAGEVRLGAIIIASVTISAIPRANRLASLPHASSAAFWLGAAT